MTEDVYRSSRGSYRVHVTRVRHAERCHSSTISAGNVLWIRLSRRTRGKKSVQRFYCPVVSSRDISDIRNGVWPLVRGFGRRKRIAIIFDRLKLLYSCQKSSVPTAAATTTSFFDSIHWAPWTFRTRFVRIASPNSYAARCPARSVNTFFRGPHSDYVRPAGRPERFTSANFVIAHTFFV